MKIDSNFCLVHFPGDSPADAREEVKWQSARIMTRNQLRHLDTIQLGPSKAIALQPRLLPASNIICFCARSNLVCTVSRHDEKVFSMQSIPLSATSDSEQTTYLPQLEMANEQAIPCKLLDVFPIKDDEMVLMVDKTGQILPAAFTENRVQPQRWQQPPLHVTCVAAGGSHAQPLLCFVGERQPLLDWVQNGCSVSIRPPYEAILNSPRYFWGRANVLHVLLQHSSGPNTSNTSFLESFQHICNHIEHFPDLFTDKVTFLSTLDLDAF